jgi:hypothetical protein
MKKANDLFSPAEAEKSAGWLSVFRTVACIGDSLSSGELVSKDADGKNQYNDFYEYSWGQFLARKYGISVYNFSRGGMTAREYMTTFADSKRFFSPQLAAQAYYIALGVNDLICQNHEIGTADDVDAANPDTFAGYFAAIIKKYKELQPRAKFFLITMPGEYRDDDRKIGLKKAHRKLMYEFAERLDNVYVIDLYELVPPYDESFERRHVMNGHLTPSGYLLTAEYIGRLTDRIIDERIEEFRDVGFIGTSLQE